MPYTVPVILMVLILNPVVMPLSLQFSWVYYISLLGSIIVLCMRQLPEKDVYLFLFMILGMLTSYVDLLTYPLITLGIPLILLLQKCRELDPVKRILKTMAVCAMWFVGYAVMWCGKWMFAFLFGHVNLLQEIFSKISEHTSMVAENTKEHITLWDSIERASSVVLSKPYVFIYLSLVIGYLIWMAYQRKKGARKQKNSIKQVLLYILPYMFLALLPFMWFCIFTSHTYAHYWFAYRELGVTIAAVGTMVLEINRQGVI